MGIIAARVAKLPIRIEDDQHRSRFEPGTRVDAGGTEATVDSLPLDRP